MLMSWNCVIVNKWPRGCWAHGVSFKPKVLNVEYGAIYVPTNCFEFYNFEFVLGYWIRMKYLGQCSRGWDYYLGELWRSAWKVKVKPDNLRLQGGAGDDHMDIAQLINILSFWSSGPKKVRLQGFSQIRVRLKRGFYSGCCCAQVIY